MTYLQHVSVQVCHLQGAQYAKFKTICQRWAISAVCSNTDVDENYVYEVKFVQFF
jgi:hypothetical protein